MARRLCYTSAGHPPVLLVEPDKDATFLQGARGWPLESPTRTPTTGGRRRAPPGSTIVLYTDGLIERRNERLEDGLARLRAAAPRATLPVEQFCDELLDGFVGTDMPTMSPSSCSASPCRLRPRSRAAPAVGAPRASDPRCASARQSEASEALRDDMASPSAKRAPTRSNTRRERDQRDTVVVEGFRRNHHLVFTVRDYGTWRPLVPNRSAIAVCG